MREQQNAEQQLANELRTVIERAKLEYDMTVCQAIGTLEDLKTVCQAIGILEDLKHELLHFNDCADETKEKDDE